jgi:hypothetical protein
MKKLFGTVAVLSTILMVSCQKELSEQTGGTPTNPGGGNTSLGLLVKAVSKSGSDSTVLSFGYNSAKKLTSMNTTGVSSGSAIDVSERFVRNSAGIITQTITKSPTFAQYGIDSLITDVHYNTTTGRYTSRVTLLNLVVFSILDSVALTYDASGKVIMEKDYVDDGTGGGYEEQSKTEFTYSGNNLLSAKSSSYDVTTSTYTVDNTNTFTYDSKVSPLILGNEAFAIDYSNFYSANNVVKMVVDVPADPTQNQTTNSTYTYNSANKPVTGTGVVTGGQTVNATYTYN